MWNVVCEKAAILARKTLGVSLLVSNYCAFTRAVYTGSKSDISPQIYITYTFSSDIYIYV